MDDNVMYAWQVVGDYNDFVHFTCARKEMADYLRDMMQAHEENKWRDVAKQCNMPYSMASRGHEEFTIQECEVIL